MFRRNTFIGRTVAVACTIALAAGLSSAVASSSQAVTSKKGTSGEVKSISKLVPASIKAKGVFTSVGAAYPPAFIHNTDNTLTGWDVETIRQVAAILGLKVQITDIAWASVIPGIAAGKYDTAMGEIYINPDRLKVVDFVTTHKSGDVLMVPVASPIKTASTDTDLCGYALTASSGSAEEKLIQDVITSCNKAGQEGTQLRSFATAAQSNLALSQGRVQAAVNSASQAAYIVKQTMVKGKAQFRVVNLPFAQSFDVGIAVARNSDSDQFDKAIQAAVNYMIKNGQLQKINDKFNEGQGMITDSVILPAK